MGNLYGWKKRNELNKVATYRYAMLEAKSEKQEKDNYKKLYKLKRRKLNKLKDVYL